MSTGDVTTALTLVIPNEFHEKINEKRSLYDRAYPRWMPHINFIFPFVPKSQFSIIKQKLETELSVIGKFTIKLNKIGYFAQGKNITMHIKSSNTESLSGLFALIQAALPDIPVKHDKFSPHVTLGQFKKSELAERTRELEEWLGDGIDIVVDAVSLISREGNAPFVVIDRVQLF